MKSVVSLAIFAISVLSTTVDEHFDALGSIIKQSETLDSPMLTQLAVHVSLKNPIATIRDTCVKLEKQIEAEKKALRLKESADRAMCDKTIQDYSHQTTQLSNDINNLIYRGSIYRGYITHKQTVGILDQLNSTRKAIRGSVANQEATVRAKQAKRDKAHQDFLALKQAFYWAFSNVTAIYRVLNGEGTLNDLFHQKGLIETELVPSKHMMKLSNDFAKIPQLSSMLQVFSKSFQKVEAVPAKTALGTQAKTQASTKDMDGVNALLQKIRENLRKALTAAIVTENYQIDLWKTEKRKLRGLINDDWIQHWENYQTQGREEVQIGKWWEQEGHFLMAQAKKQKSYDYFMILHDFLETRCELSRDEFVTAITGIGNQLNALSRVDRYIQGLNWHNMYSGNNTIMDVVSSPYKWKIEAPRYVSVSGTYSTADHVGVNNLACSQGYSTVFSKVRVLESATGNQFFLDPNDLTHTKNLDVKRQNTLKLDPSCEIFPTGIPLGRAHSCSEKEYSTAVIDLNGTPFTFGLTGKNMFKILGRKTKGSTVTLDPTKKKITLRIKGRCGDVYGDDMSALGVDYRSDPIPLNGNLARALPTPNATNTTAPTVASGR